MTQKPTVMDLINRLLPVVAGREQFLGIPISTGEAAGKDEEASGYKRLGTLARLARHQSGDGLTPTPGVVPTPEDEAVMILRLPRTPTLDVNAPLSAEWREDALW